MAQAQCVLGEARDRVRGLRAHAAPETLEPAIVQAARDRGFRSGGDFFITTFGTARRVGPVAASEVVRIAEEALFNIAKHARATRVEVHIDYRPDRLQITFGDDGVGIESAVLRAGRREGHYGLAGMRERAAKLKGDMIFDKASGGGSEVILMAPRRIMYERTDHWRPLNPLRRCFA